MALGSTIRKHHSEAVEGMECEWRNAGLDGQRKGHFLVNVQDMTLQTTGGADEWMGQSDAEREQCGNGYGIVELRSYRDVLVGG